MESQELADSVYVCETSDLPMGAMKLVPGIDRVDVVVVNDGGEYFAITNICTHKGAPLCEGEMKDHYLVCPWHKAMFRLKDGKCVWPATRNVRSYPVRVEGSSIYVDKKRQI